MGDDEILSKFSRTEFSGLGKEEKITWTRKTETSKTGESEKKTSKDPNEPNWKENTTRYREKLERDELKRNKLELQTIKPVEIQE